MKHSARGRMKAARLFEGEGTQSPTEKRIHHENDRPREADHSQDVGEDVIVFTRKALRRAAFLSLGQESQSDGHCVNLNLRPNSPASTLLGVKNGGRQEEDEMKYTVNGSKRSSEATSHHNLTPTFPEASCPKPGGMRRSATLFFAGVRVTLLRGLAAPVFCACISAKSRAHRGRCRNSVPVPSHLRSPGRPSGGVPCFRN